MELVDQRREPVFSMSHSGPIQLGNRVKIVKTFNDGSVETYEGILHDWQMNQCFGEHRIVARVGKAEVEVYYRSDDTQSFYAEFDKPTVMYSSYRFADYRAVLTFPDYSEKS